MFNETKSLIVVYKDEMLLNELRKLVETKDDTAEAVVGVKDGSVKIVSWNEKMWLGQKKNGTINNIDSLKAVCHSYGLTGDGNEYKIITQIFLYKFLNDKFGYEVKKISEKLRNAEKWEEAYSAMTEDERLDILGKR